MKLRELRIEKGITHKQLSDDIGVPVRTISRWEKGESDMLLKNAIKLAEYFEVTLDEFINF
ncbi:helix-turn-helix transcriptional regulator [Streptococcus thermophilus]|uniref:helix-turn-helix transcriptional regulator n=1 Tax=Streptococcus thermophilus TaxID=1308 RepID=UPI00261B4C11|nr:helix-turn-helix transcriptional regulator [Streptococcus thermophilus]